MTDFFHFPSTPYLRGPAGLSPRDDKVLDEAERLSFLSHPLRVEEKVDGENLGISFDGRSLRFQARGGYVELNGRRFRGLGAWVRPRMPRIAEGLGTDLVLFGEWCSTTHSVKYDMLPDWLLVFDIYDHSTGCFWAASQRDELANELGLSVVPFLGSGTFGEAQLNDLIGTSRVGSDVMEGIVVRPSESFCSFQRAKLVRSEFLQQIGQHWTSGVRSVNRLATA